MINVSHINLIKSLFSLIFHGSLLVWQFTRPIWYDRSQVPFNMTGHTFLLNDSWQVPFGVIYWIPIWLLEGLVCMYVFYYDMVPIMSNLPHPASLDYLMHPPNHKMCQIVSRYIVCRRVGYIQREGVWGDKVISYMVMLDRPDMG